MLKEPSSIFNFCTSCLYCISHFSLFHAATILYSPHLFFNFNSFLIYFPASKKTTPYFLISSLSYEGQSRKMSDCSLLTAIQFIKQCFYALNIPLETTKDIERSEIQNINARIYIDYP